MKQSNKIIIPILAIIIIAFCLFSTPLSADNVDRLDIPEIGFSQEIIPTNMEGSEIKVPDTKPGYYSGGENNLFIVAHNTTFNRLQELPNKIIIHKDNMDREYKLLKSELVEYDKLTKSQLLGFNGVVLLTCAGQPIDNTFTHRLILYYTN